LVLLEKEPAASDRVLNTADVHLGCVDIEHISERGPPETITVLTERASEPGDRHVDRRIGIEWKSAPHRPSIISSVRTSSPARIASIASTALA
jgi:hypothetical protein